MYVSAFPHVRVTEGKPTTPHVIFPAKFSAFIKVGHAALQVHPGTSFTHHQVEFPWLCQSQSQAGTASPDALNENPNSNALWLSAEPTDDFGCGFGQHINHNHHLPYPVWYDYKAMGRPCQAALNV